MKENIILLCDDKTIGRKAASALAATGKRSVRIVRVEKTKELRFLPEIPPDGVPEDTDLLLVMRNQTLQSASRELHDRGIFSLYVCPYDSILRSSGKKFLPEDFIPVDNRLPRLQFLDVEITEHCNLKCRGCWDFSSLVCEKAFLDLGVFRKNLLRMKELFWGIGVMHIQGGEPLLNPDLEEYIRTAHEIFPDCELHIVTNGLKIPSVDKETLGRLRNYNCSINITTYPITLKNRDRIKEHLVQSEAAYRFSMPRYLFTKMILAEPHDHPEAAFRYCVIKHCSGMRGEYLSPCMFPLHIDKFNAAFGYDLPNGDRFNIHETTLSGWELLEILENKAPEFCRYCYYGMAPYVWKQRKVSDAKPEEWLVTSKFLNSKPALGFIRAAGPAFHAAYKTMIAAENLFQKR